MLYKFHRFPKILCTHPKKYRKAVAAFKTTVFNSYAALEKQLNCAAIEQKLLTNLLVVGYTYTFNLSTLIAHIYI
jgi:hypothetical protein